MTVYQDPDGQVLCRDRTGAERRTGHMVIGEDLAVYIVLRVVQLTSDHADACRTTVEATD